jgi:6-pyruvoyltetrahydropterin/6-carboxytetrahydropterin synthase
MALTQVLITHREEFAAAHKLADPERSEEENRALYGPCANLHGHNYGLEVSVEGPLDPRTGMVMDLNRLMELMRREVLREVDHRNLNEDVPFLRGRIPTAEILAVAFWERLAPHFASGGTRLARIRIVESGANWAEYCGPRS